MNAFLLPRFGRALRYVVVGGVAIVFGLSATISAVRAQYIGAQFVTNATVSNAGATAPGTNSQAAGTNATASGNQSLAEGNSAQASGLNSTALGNNAQAAAANTTAVGQAAQANLAGASAFGQNSFAAGSNSSAFGMNSTATGNNSSAFGQNAVAAGAGGSAFGFNSAASQANASAFGAGAQALNTNSSAFGTLATATAQDASAFGSGASASFTGSTAIGANATVSRANQMAFGTSTNTYTAAGITSLASRAAQSGTTQVVTSDSGGNLATTDTSTLITGNSAFQDLQADVRDNGEGVAMALAMAGSPSVLPDNKAVAVSANYGGFQGESAGAFSGVARVQGDLFFNAGVGFTTHTSGGRCGLTFAW